MAEVTDEVVDSLLPRYKKTEDYPALTTENLARRERRELLNLDPMSFGRQGYWYVRQIQEQSAAIQAGAMSVTVDPLQSYIEQCTDAQMIALLAQLGRGERDSEVIWLVYRSGWPQQEAAKKYGLSRQSVHRLLQLFLVESRCRSEGGCRHR